MTDLFCESEMRLLDFFANAADALINRISALIYGKRKYSLSTDWIKDDFSIAYTSFPLPKECKHVQVYYAREAIFEYKNLMTFIMEYVKLEDMNLIGIMDTIIRYIEGWSTMKEITPDMLKTLNKMIARRQEILSYHRNRYEDHLKEFKRYNDDKDGLVDSFVMTLFRYNKDIQYIRIFKHFFKKGAFDLKFLQKRYDSEIAKMEEMTRCIKNIQRVREYSGKTEEIDKLRKEAVAFLQIIQKMTNLVEQDLNFIEKMASINKLVIAFKVYPYYGMNED